MCDYVAVTDEQIGIGMPSSNSTRVRCHNTNTHGKDTNPSLPHHFLFTSASYAINKRAYYVSCSYVLVSDSVPMMADIRKKKSTTKLIVIGQDINDNNIEELYYLLIYLDF